LKESDERKKKNKVGAQKRSGEKDRLGGGKGQNIYASVNKKRRGRLEKVPKSTGKKRAHHSNQKGKKSGEEEKKEECQRGIFS